jgi:hypothetical protein
MPNMEIANMMGNAVETSSKWAVLTLVLTTCAVLIYLILLLTSIFKGTRHVKSVLKIGAEEVMFETKQGKQFQLRYHKVFWICVGAAYGLAILFIVWYFILIPAVIYLGGKLLGKVKLKKA